MTAAKVMDITSRLPGCSGQAGEGQGMGPQGMSATGGGGLARVLNLRVCQHPSCPVWHTQGGKDELTPWYRLVGVAVLPVSRKGGRTGLPARASGRHVVRGRQSSPVLEVRPGNRQGWWKLSTFRWEGRQLTLDKTVGSLVWWHTRGSSKRPALDLGWGSSWETAPGSLSTESPAGRTPSARRRLNVQSGLRKGGKVLRSPARA